MPVRDEQRTPCIPADFGRDRLTEPLPSPLVRGGREDPTRSFGVLVARWGRCSAISLPPILPMWWIVASRQLFRTVYRLPIDR